MNLPRAGQSQPKGRIRPAGRKMPRSALFRGRQLTRRAYGHFAAFLCFKKFFLSHLYVDVFFVLKQKTNKLN